MTGATRNSQKGLTMMEVLAALAMLSIFMLASISLTESSTHLTRGNSDRQFATQKAIAIMEELKSVATSNVSASGQALAVLDQYDNGTDTLPELTIQVGATPGDRISGNQPDGTGGWRYARRVSISRLGGVSTGGVRLVRVTIFGNEQSGQRPLAEVSSVIRTLASSSPPTQVYDVFAVAIENVPGWWVYTASLVPFVQNAVSELQARNPGLEFRVHWITKLSYGRDKEYRPYINRTLPSTSDINSVYFYPGTLPVNAALNPPALTEYYPTSQFGARMNRDGILPANQINNYVPARVVWTDPQPNPVPYALADQYNHTMRYYEERDVYRDRLAAVDFDGTKIYPNEEPTYRLLLDDMVLQPQNYTNAILINLHGELFPFPPVRNYSDAAKLPGDPGYSNIRAVTHPERMTYDALTPMRLRVYAYEAWRDRPVPPAPALIPDATAFLGPLPGVPSRPITLVIPGLNLTGAITIAAIEGGTNQTVGVAPPLVPNNQTYRITSPAPVAPGATNRMYWTMENRVYGGQNNTVIQLFNTPYRTPSCSEGPLACGNNTGLFSTRRLYNMDYIPSPAEVITTDGAALPANDIDNAFTMDLTNNVQLNVKNTARWIITINPAGPAGLNAILAAAGAPLDRSIEVRTTLGPPPAAPDLPTSGRIYPIVDQPSNLSRTYLWRGTNQWLWGNAAGTIPPNVPPTERFQFIGDPRHCPYADAKMQHDGTLYGLGPGLPAGTGQSSYPMAMGYNRYFDDFHAAVNAGATWQGWAYAGGMGVKNLDGNSTNDGWIVATTNPADGPFGQLEIDIPRAFQTLRTALTTSRTIYTTMTGYSYYYVGIGGEIGYDDANRFPNSIPVSTMPFSGASGTTTEQSITNDLGWGNPNGCNLPQGCGVKYVRAVGTALGYWWSINWLGELYPDTAANTWRDTGNLPTGNAATNYRRVLRGLIAPPAASPNPLPVGTVFLGGLGAAGEAVTQGNAVRRTLGQGSTSFFWTGTAADATFHHTSNNNNGTLTGEGLNMDGATPPTPPAAAGYNFPLLNPVPNNRPFNINLNVTADNPEQFYLAPSLVAYGAIFTSQVETQFYRQLGTGGPGSALVSLRNPTNNRVAFVVVNGLSPTGDSGSNFIARWSFLSLIHSYMVAGRYADAVGCAGCPFRVAQLPRVEIITPNVTTELDDPSSVSIQWASSWRRWDNRVYTPSYPVNFNEAAAVQVQVLYSRDNGVTWKWIQDNTDIPADQLEKLNPAKVIPGGVYLWSTPAGSFPDGNYLIRVEAYRVGFPLHYAYHQFMAYIRRP